MRVTFYYSEIVIDEGNIEETPIGFKLGKHQQKILKYFENNTSITNSDVVELTGLKATRAKEILNEMVTQQILEARGEKRYRYYILKKDTR